MPYKDIENRRKAIRNHYKNNKAYYQKKSNKWKIDNTEKVRASRIRYQEKIKLKKLLDIIIDLKKENKEYQKEQFNNLSYCPGTKRLTGISR